MVYITQLIFVKEGKEDVFHQFEDLAIPLIEKYNGRIIHRIRPDKHSFIAGDSELPYEIHLVSFDSERDLENFMKDDTRQQFIHLKDESVRSMLLVKGTKM